MIHQVFGLESLDPNMGDSGILGLESGQVRQTLLVVGVVSLSGQVGSLIYVNYIGVQTEKVCGLSPIELWGMVREQILV